MTQSLFRAATDDHGLCPSNPTTGLARRLRLHEKAPRTAELPALTVRELGAFLRTVAERYPHLSPLFEVYARAGLRLGEGLALRWEDVTPGALRVARTYSDKMILSTKTGLVRTVEIGPRLDTVLAAVPRWPDTPWCFPSLRTGGLWDARGSATCASASAVRSVCGACIPMRCGTRRRPSGSRPASRSSG